LVGEHSGALESWVGLFNTYNDLGTWHCVTPYIGGGVGFASISVLGYKDVNAETGRIATYDNANKSGGLVIEDITSHAVSSACAGSSASSRRRCASLSNKTSPSTRLLAT
jgi:opacity protein-like surface antigen